MSAAMPVLEGRNSSTAEGAIIGGVLGAIVGAGIGFAAGGPVGAVIGGFAGAGSGRASEPRSVPRWVARRRVRLVMRGPSIFNRSSSATMPLTLRRREDHGRDA